METARSFLVRAQGQEVMVRLRDRKLRGRLEGADEFINLYLEDVEELRDEVPNAPPRRFQRAVVRGSQVLAVHATKLGPPAPEPRTETVWSGSRADHGDRYRGRRDDGPPRYYRR